MATRLSSSCAYVTMRLPVTTLRWKRCSCMEHTSTAGRARVPAAFPRSHHPLRDPVTRSDSSIVHIATRLTTCFTLMLKVKLEVNPDPPAPRKARCTRTTRASRLVCRSLVSRYGPTTFWASTWSRASRSRRSSLHITCLRVGHPQRKHMPLKFARRELSRSRRGPRWDPRIPSANQLSDRGY
jgi:hypothetical protein